MYAIITRVSSLKGCTASLVQWSFIDLTVAMLKIFSINYFVKIKKKIIKKYLLCAICS